MKLSEYPFDRKLADKNLELSKQNKVIQHELEQSLKLSFDLEKRLKKFEVCKTNDAISSHAIA